VSRKEQIFRGRGLSPGIGQGRAVLYPAPAAVPESGPAVAAPDPGFELRRLEFALDSARRDLERVRLRVRADVGAEEAEIFAAHELLLADADFLARIRERLLRECVVAERAVQAEFADAAKRLAAIDDPYLRERHVDVRDVGRRLLSILSSPPSSSIAPLPSGSVLIAVELLPSDTVDLDRAHVAAVVTEAGGETSHVAILARALGIPAVTAVVDATRSIPTGAEVLVDGDQGEVTVFPSGERSHSFSIRSAASFERTRAESASHPTECRTRDGERIGIRANLGRAEEVHDVRRYGLDGVGLFRTEFLFLDSREPPSFERQAGVYRQVLQALDGLPLTIRTLDLGGDKIPLFLAPHAERNPSLGLRGLRFSLREERMFETQLRAIVHAASAGPVRVLFPMVLGDADLKEATARLREAGKGGTRHPEIQVGSMIETPAAVFLIDQILDEVDFVSLGTNDLTQFVLAADRDAIDLLDGYSVLHPSVLRAIAHVVDAARDRGRPVSVCGEAAGDPATAALFLGLGVRELSMSPRRALRVRQAIARLECSAAEALASEALACRTNREAKQRVAAFARDVLGDATSSIRGT
jgi:phosphoenolpyruvate-protein phosphotransferase (PTS system enzyme I)